MAASLCLRSCCAITGAHAGPPTLGSHGANNRDLGTWVHSAPGHQQVVFRNQQVKWTDALVTAVLIRSENPKKYNTFVTVGSDTESSNQYS